MEDIIGHLLIIREEQNIAFKFKDDHLPDDHANYLIDLTLPNSPLLPKNHCFKKHLQLMTRENKNIWDLIDTIKTGRPMRIHGSYMKNFSNDLHEKDDLLFLDNKSSCRQQLGEPSAQCYTRTAQANSGINFLQNTLVASNLPRDMSSREVL